ncbi:MAG: hypothetical protein KAJ19_14440, partial [Gammaproteobacteria bacterium]|nr:hypothetical protein [Gammaproteobacteria bacterium]
FEEFVKKVVTRDPVGTMRRAVKQVDENDREEVVLQMFQSVYPIGYTKRLGASSREVGRNITKAQDMLLELYVGSVDSPRVFTDINWILNVVHQGGKMADHVARDMGISVRYLNKLSNLDTSGWDQELQTMATPTESVIEYNIIGRRTPQKKPTRYFPHGFVIDGMYVDIEGDTHVIWAAREFGYDFTGPIELENIADTVWDTMAENGWIRLTNDEVHHDIGGVDFLGGINDGNLRTVQKALLDEGVNIKYVAVDASGGFNVTVSYEDFMDARSPMDLRRKRLESVIEGRLAEHLNDMINVAVFHLTEDEDDEVQWDDIYSYIDKHDKKKPKWSTQFDDDDEFDDDEYGDEDLSPEAIKWLRDNLSKKSTWKRKAPGMYINWEIPGQLGRTSRPGYPSRKQIPLAKVDEWIMRAKKHGIKSIILLLGPDQLHLYSSVPGGLPDYYRKNGFEVVHIPMFDLHKFISKKSLKLPGTMKHVSPKDLEKAYAAYQPLPKPVLVHCSAGIDRRRATVEYIADQEFGPLESAELVESSADASSYLLEALGSYDYKIPDDKEKLLYDFYMATYLPAPSILADLHGWAAGMSPKQMLAYKDTPGMGPRIRQPRPDLAMAVEDTRKKIVDHLKPELLNAVFFSIACEARYIFEQVGPSEEIFRLAEKEFGKEMARRLRRYWTEYSHFKKYEVEKGEVREAPRAHPEFMADASNRNAAYRAALKAFKGHLDEFVRFTEWGF